MKTSTFLVILLFTAFSTVYAQEPSADCLIANYNLEGNALDDSDNGYDGIVNGAMLTTNQYDQTDMAYLFDATNDFIEVPSFPDLGTSDFSLELWMNTYSYLGIPPASRPISKGVTGHGTPANAGFCIQLHELNGVNELRFFLGHSDGDRTFTTSSFPPQNEWFHVVAIREATEMHVYINGILSATATTPVIYNVDTDIPFTIGAQLRNAASSLSFFDGKIGTCRVYNKALTSGEVTFLYNDAPLATELTNFTAKVKRSNVELNWETFQETNHKAFVLEHSTNGFDFLKIDKINGSTSSQFSKKYTSIHYSPIIGENYYRLKQINMDGSDKYFPVKVIDFKKEDAPFLVYPTFAKDEFILELKHDSDLNTTMKIFNQLGQLVYSDDIKTDIKIKTVNCSDWESGLYMIQIERGQTIETGKIIKIAAP